MRSTLNIIFILLVSYFLGMSLFFSLNVYNFKKSLFIPATNIVIKNKSKVKVIKILDGDEVVIRFHGDNYVVRILGIKSYETSVNDFSVHNASQYSIQFLQDQLSQKIIELQFKKFKIDSHKRILAYIQLDNRDIGYEMIEKGISLVFTKYPFSRMEKYLKAEKKTRKEKVGLWAIPVLEKRSLIQKAIWNKEKK